MTVNGVEFSFSEHIIDYCMTRKSYHQDNTYVHQYKL